MKFLSTTQLSKKRRISPLPLFPSPHIWKRTALKWKPESKREQDLGSSVCLVPRLGVTSMSYIRNTWPVESRRRRNLHHEEVPRRPGSYQLSRLPALLASRGMNIPSLIDAEISTMDRTDHIPRKLILNGISWTIARWIKIQKDWKIWKFRRVDKLR